MLKSYSDPDATQTQESWSVAAAITSLKPLLQTSLLVCHSFDFSSLFEQFFSVCLFVGQYLLYLSL